MRNKLMEAGVSTGSIRLLGVIHDSALLNPITKAPSIRAEVAASIHALKHALAKK